MRDYIVGQKVAVKTRYDTDIPYTFETIVRVTKTIVTTDAGKYSFRGQEWGTGSSWHYKYIDLGMPIEEAVLINNTWLEDHRRDRLVTIIRGFVRPQWYALTTEQLEHIIAMVSNAQPDKPTV